MMPSQKPPSRQNMRTPQWLFDWLSHRYGPFVLDAAASNKNTMCEEYYDQNSNALIKPWYNKTFCNPPFKKFGEWIQKADYEAATRGVNTIMLAPVGCSQNWYHNIAKHWTIFVPDKRISFCMPDGTPTNGADRDTIFIGVGPQFKNDSLYSFKCLPVTLPCI